MSKRIRAGKKNRKGGKGVGWNEKIIIGIVLVVAIWAAYSFNQPSPSATTTTQTPGAPDFTLPVIDQNGLTGQKPSLSSFRGKVVLLEFMTPNCPHCKTMASVLENLYRQCGRESVVFLTAVEPSDAVD